MLNYTHLSVAIQSAVAAHTGQVDKQNQPYILHPLRVMARVQQMVGLKTDYLIVAVMHDTVEDTYITLKSIKSILGEHIAEAIDSVTKRDGENYLDFVRRSKRNEIGKVVKIADIKDNRDRIPAKLDSKWWGKLHTKYTVALAILEDNHEWLEANKDLVAGLEAQ